MAAEEMGLDPHTGLQEEMHPLMMQSFRALKGKHNDPDLPSVMESVNGPHVEEFWKAMDAEITGLEAKQAWEVVERSSIPANMKAIPAPGPRESNGNLQEISTSSRVAGPAVGDMQQTEGIETYAPLVGWPPVRAAMLLAATHVWET